MIYIIDYIFGKTFLRIGFKILIFGLISALFIGATTIFIEAILTQIEDLAPQTALTNFTYVLSALLPANTLTFISIIFNAQLISIAFNKTMWFINSKRLIFGINV